MRKIDTSKLDNLTLQGLYNEQLFRNEQLRHLVEVLGVKRKAEMQERIDKLEKKLDLMSHDLNRYKSDAAKITDIKMILDNQFREISIKYDYLRDCDDYDRYDY